MKTSQAVSMFLDSRRSQMASPTTIRAYTWALEKMESMYTELPGRGSERHAAAIPGQFGTVARLSPQPVEKAAHVLGMGGGRRDRPQHNVPHSITEIKAEAAAHPQRS